MRKFTVLTLLLLFLPTTALAEEKEEVKYEVTINVTYNAITIEEANKIIADALERYKTACKTNMKAKKVSDSDIYITDTVIYGYASEED